MYQPTARPRNPRYASLDAWRGLACLMIVVLHAAHYAGQGGGEPAGPGGAAVVRVIGRLGVGVPMFFVISGYCIAATADSARRRPRSPGRFFYRRFRRIYPPFWVLGLASLALVVVLTAAGEAGLVSDGYGNIPHPSALSWSQWAGNVALIETWRPHLFGGPELKVIGPSWTLCYEEQFYAVCGLLLIVSPRRFFAGTAVVTGLTLAVAPLAFAGPGLAIQGFFFDGRWLMFAEGIAAYCVLNYSRPYPHGVALFGSLLAAAAALRWAVPAVAGHELGRDRVWEFVASTAFALAIVVLHRFDERIGRAPAVRPLALCGRMCYSLYLVHWPVTVVVTAYFYRAGVRGVWPTLLVVLPIAVASSLFFSWLFYLTVERRFLNAPVGRPTARPEFPGPDGRAGDLVETDVRGQGERGSPASETPCPYPAA